MASMIRFSLGFFWACACRWPYVCSLWLSDGGQQAHDTRIISIYFRLGQRICGTCGTKPQSLHLPPRVQRTSLRPEGAIASTLHASSALQILLFLRHVAPHMTDTVPPPRLAVSPASTCSLTEWQLATSGRRRPSCISLTVLASSSYPRAMSMPRCLSFISRRPASLFCAGTLSSSEPHIRAGSWWWGRTWPSERPMRAYHAEQLAALQSCCCRKDAAREAK